MTFDDVPRGEWYAEFIEFAASKQWMRGYQNCIGTHPCSVVPGSTITRAEAIAMVVRFHELKPLHIAPLFRDVSADAWYAKEMAIAADHCIAQPASASYSARPSELLTRAQMVVLLDRASKPLVYGQDCTWPSTIRSSSSSSVTSRRSSQSSILSSSSLSSVQQSSVPHSALSSSHASSVSARSESSSEQKALSGSTILRPAAPSQNAMLPIVTMAFIGILGLGVAARLFFKAELSAL